jgi:nitroreductase
MRQYDHEILNIIKKRWSPRAISSEPIDQELIKTILEAARFAPSCFNEQPWRFIVANTESSLQKMRSLLAKENQIWANSAPVLIMVLCNNRFTYNDKDNFWAKFDTGASWAFLSLEATEHELVTHAMGGFNRNNAISAYSLDPNTEPIAIIAMGKYGDPALLPNSLKEREFPESRKQLDEFVVWDK